MIDYLQSQGVEVRYGYEVKDLDRESDGTWTVSAINRINTEEPLKIHAKICFSRRWRRCFASSPKVWD